ncbi:hypothetical protein [Streptomyces sp. bgisy034]|uniref:hypothetical protein n=1 Tax=Streptomyces sp. bgisy034 TaxID=3413774 RepID=UPI003EBA0464
MQQDITGDAPDPTDRAILAYLERRIASRLPDPLEQNHGAYVGAFLDLVDRVAPLYREGRLIYPTEVVATTAPMVAATDVAAAEFDPRRACLGWGDSGYQTAAVLGYLSATHGTVLPSVVGELRQAHRSDYASLYLDAVELRFALRAAPESADVRGLLPLARRIRTVGPDRAWVYLFEALPAAFRAGGSAFMHEMLAEVPVFMAEESKPFARFRLTNSLALAARWTGDLDRAMQLVDLAESELVHSDLDLGLRRRYLGLMDSNRALILFDAGHDEEAEGAITRAVRTAPYRPGRWLHAERGVRIAGRLGRFGQWYEFLREHGELRPDGFDDDDVYYQARRYFSLIPALLDKLGEADLKVEGEQLAQHALGLLEWHVPRWDHHRKRLLAAAS